MTKGYSELTNERVSAANGVDFAYRDTGGGEGAVPLVLETLSQLPPSVVLFVRVQFNVPDPPFRIGTD